MHAQPRTADGRVTATPSVKHTCERCLRTDWKYLKTQYSDRLTARVRTYVCPCGARLYTHETTDTGARIPLGPAVGIARRTTDQPCDACGHLTHHVSTHECSRPNLRRYQMTCAQCGHTTTSTERAAGQTDGPTPRNARGRRPHPLL